MKRNGSFSFIPGKRRYLLYADDIGISAIQPIMDILIENGLPFELKFKNGHHQSNDIVEWLSMQKMGCYLYGAANRDTAEQMEQIAEEAGFSKEEMQWIGIGTKNMKVFCSRCHSVQQAGTRRELICINCGLPLSVSDHFSAHHKAYLGYPT